MSTDISAFTLDDSALPPPTPEIEQERNIAIFDLLEANTFRMKSGAAGPYSLTMALKERLLTFTAQTEAGETNEFTLPYSPFRKAARAYYTVCESYLAAVRLKTPEEIARLPPLEKASPRIIRMLLLELRTTYFLEDWNGAVATPARPQASASLYPPGRSLHSKIRHPRSGSLFESAFANAQLLASPDNLSLCLFANLYD